MRARSAKAGNGRVSPASPPWHAGVRLHMRIVFGLVFAAIWAAAHPAETQLLIPEGWSRSVIVTVPRANPKPPTIDGYVDYREWYYASCVDAFIDYDTGNLTDLPVWLYLCYDDDNLYVGLVISRPPNHPAPRAVYPPGQHPDLWWKDDGFELVLWPGRPEKGLRHYYAFCGNSVGGWSNMCGPLEGTGGDATWPGKWVYKTQRAGLEAWHAELAIPVNQFPDAEPPRPGAVWRINVMNQQLTPAKRMADLGLVWSLNADGYRSPYLARLIFVGDGPIVRPHGIGRLPVSASGPPTTGLRQVFYNQGQQPLDLFGQAWLYRASVPGGPDALAFFEAWDRILRIRATGKPSEKAWRGRTVSYTEAELKKELNQRYELIASRGEAFSVPAAGAAYFNLEQPAAPGEYIAAWCFADANTGEVLNAQVVPYAILPALTVTTRPHFLKHDKVEVEACLCNVEPKGGDRLEFSLRTDKGPLDATTLPVDDGGSVRAYLDAARLATGSTGKVVVRLLHADGTEAMTQSQVVFRPPPPDWFGNSIGRSRVVPPPFEPVRSPAPGVAQVWQRKVTFGRNGLPAVIQARGTDLLSRPISLHTGSVKVEWQSRQVRLDDRDMVIEARGSAPALGFRLRSTFHYDGTLRCDVEIVPTAREAILERLALEVPVAVRWARLVTHNALYTDPLRADDTGFAGTLDEWFARYPSGAIPFTYACQLGAEDRGIQWFCESDRGWSNRDETRVVRLMPRQEEVVLAVAMVDKPLKLSGPWRTTFGITILPVKDASFGRAIVTAAEGHPAAEPVNLDEGRRRQFFDAYRAAGITHIFIYMNDDDFFGCPRIYAPRSEVAVRQFVERAHKEGFGVIPYAGWGVNANIPDFDTFGQEMLARPITNIGWGCFLHNPASVFADWWLAGAKHTIEQMGMDGIYLDGTALPTLITNELDGFSWTDAQNRIHGTYPIWAIRDFLERLYVYTHVEAPKCAVVRNHYSRQQLYCLGAFCDQHLNGENYYHKGKTVLEVATPGEFRAFFMTHLNGVATWGMWPGWLNLPVTPNEMQGMFLLHDVPRDVGGGVVCYHAHDVGYGRDKEPWVRIKRLRDEMADAEFVGYWAEKPLAVCQPVGPLASGWVDRAARRALIVIANLSSAPWAGAVHFDFATLGVGADALLSDAMLDHPLPLERDGSLDLTIEPQSYRLVLIEPSLSMGPAEK